MFSRLVGGVSARWAARRIGKIEPADPTRTLRALLHAARDTTYGRAHGFEDLLHSPDPYAGFIERVPILDYPAWLEWLDNQSSLAQAGARPLTNVSWPGTIDMFCLSSGTTSGRTKHIPYSAAMAAVNREAALDFFAFAVHHIPAISPLLCKTLYMSGGTQISRNEHGALCGDMSGLTKYLAPRFLDHLTLPAREVSGLEPWSRRLEALVELCLSGAHIGAISGIPIWQLTLLEAVQQQAQKPFSEIMPDLRFLIHGGMSMGPYRDRIRALVGETLQLLEIYAASETGIAAYQVPGEDGMRFQEGYRVFYELEAPDGAVLRSNQVQAQVAYSLIISSCSGLWRYRIGDVVVFRETKPLILDYVSRDKTTSAFDEKITEKELERAMSLMKPAVTDFCMGPDVQGRRHMWFLIRAEPFGAGWLERLDQHLRDNNQDYDDYRGDGRINPPTMWHAPNRAAFLQALGREEGGQRKFPRLLSPDEVTRLCALLSGSGQALASD